jgi:hypothetical protein
MIAQERLDFSCALFSPDGGLVANAPHVPVHLGAMSSTVRWQLAYWSVSVPLHELHQICELGYIWCFWRFISTVFETFCGVFISVQWQHRHLNWVLDYFAGARTWGKVMCWWPITLHQVAAICLTSPWSLRSVHEDTPLNSYISQRVNFGFF